MPKYIIKEAATGLIRKFVTTPPNVEYPTQFVEADATLLELDWAEGQADSSRFYVLGNDLLERPKLFEQDEISIPADGVTKVTALLLKGTAVRFNGEVTTAGKRQPFEFIAEVAGEYIFEIEPPFPLQRQRLRIIAHEV
jgi:hypothetical protein